MVTLNEVAGLGLLQSPSEAATTALERTESNYKSLENFVLPKDRQYQQQFADIYFLRLAKIKPAVEEVASAAWEGTTLGGETATKVDRVLDVRQGQLCWVAGTIYMDMPLKPSVLEDVAKDRWISAPTTADRYYSEAGGESIMLEDDSGRIRLVGDVLKNYFLVTGCIIAVMGTENVNGEFEVIDLKFADLPPQPERWALSRPAGSAGDKKPKVRAEVKEEDVEMSDSRPSKKIAIVSGLEFSGTDTSYAMELDLLLEFLLGEALDPAAQAELAHISRLIIAGNSIAKPSEHDAADRKGHKKYGYDASSYNPVPSQLLDGFLATLLPTIPVTLLPGAHDPANASYPQQPIHSAMFPAARAYPFQDDEPFVMKDCPHLYFVGCQPEFGTKVIEGPQGQMVRLVLVPSFAATKEIVLVDTETLDVSKVKITI
ncbi:hypothetical protein VTH06DRAFT_6545 [Thermothelomyces fergusii]